MPKCVDLEQLLCDRMLELMKEKPFYKIKVTDLVRYANVSRSTFYLYYDSIYDVVEKMERDFFSGLIAEEKAAQLGVPGLNSGPDKDLELKEAIRITTGYLCRQEELFTILSGPNGDPAFNARLQQRTRRWVESVLQGNRYFSRDSAELVAEFASSGVQAFQRYIVQHKDRYTEEQMANMAFNLLRGTLSALNI